MQTAVTKGQESGNKLFGNDESGLFSWKKSIGGILASSAAIIFGVAVLLMSLLAVSNPVAVHPSEETATPAGEMNATSAALMKIEYYLPYPGLLPDSPLYKVKALRDRIMLWLTFGDQNKARKELLFADKRINAAIFLIQGGKNNLGVTTATKAEKYLESAVNGAVKASGAGQDAKSLLEDLAKSCTKHLEVLQEIIPKVNTEGQRALEAISLTTKASLERVNQALAEAE